MNSTRFTALPTGRRTARLLGLATLAAPLAAALAVGTGAAAHAEDDPSPLITVVDWDVVPAMPADPGDLTGEDCPTLDVCPGPVDPDPGEDPDPTVPEGPGDITTEEPCWQTDTCTVDPDPGEDPDPTVPEGPGDITTEEPCWQTDTCTVDPDPGDDNPGDDPGDDGSDEPGDSGADQPAGDPGADDDYAKPTRIDAGASGPGGGLDLAWLLPGGLLVTASGAAYAARRTRAGHQG